MSKTPKTVRPTTPSEFETPIDTPLQPTYYEVLDDLGEVIGKGITPRLVFDELVAAGHNIRLMELPTEGKQRLI